MILKKLKQKFFREIEKVLLKYTGYIPKVYWYVKGITFADEHYQQKIYPQHEWLKDIINTKVRNHVLEVGCGFGRNLQYILNECGQNIRQLSATDISATLLYKARKRLSTKVDFFDSDIKSLPFEDNKFDFVFTHGVLMHVAEDVNKALEELIRVCSDDIVIIEEYKEIKNG